MHHTWLPHLQTSSYKMELPNPPSTEWIAGNSRLFSRSLQQEHKWNKTRTQLVEHPPKKWNTTGTQLEHNWYMHHKWRRHLRMSSYKMESPDPVYRMDCWNLTAIFQEPWTGTQVEHPPQKWNTTGTRLEHLPQKCRCWTPTPEVEKNWNTSGTQLAHHWYMHHKWRCHLPMSSYKMESPDPQSTEWIAGNSRLFSRSLELEHKWNTHPRSGTQLEQDWNTCCRSAGVERPPQKWKRTGTQVGHNWHITGTCITSDDAICPWVLTKWNHQTHSLQNGLLEKLEANTGIRFFFWRGFTDIAFTFIVACFTLDQFGTACWWIVQKQRVNLATVG